MQKYPSPKKNIAAHEKSRRKQNQKQQNKKNHRIRASGFAR